MLKDALKKRDYSEDALILAKAATIIRNDTFRHECFKFDGNFPSKCQENSIPSCLKSLISLIYNGPNLKDQDKEESHACISVRQLIVFNMKKSTSTSGTKERHTLDREPPLPTYIGLNIHQQTRCKKLIMQLYCMGISISYDRVLDLEDRIATSVCEQCDEDGVVSPICLKKQLFTVGAIDNLDYNPSSTTSQSSFHGTGISLIQFPTKDNPGIDRPLKSLPQSTDRKYNLPGSYEIVPAVALRPNDVTVPILNCNTEQRQSHFDEAFAKQKSWVSHALHLLENEDLHNDDKIVWGAYHALQQQPSLEDPLGVCALLPLFYEKAATPSMVKHGMEVQRQATDYLNPGQIPVTAFDQPLFAIAKYVQWKWPATHGEHVHVIMLGGLHTEMALWRTLGDVLEGSGWTAALTEAEIASPGIVDSFLNVSHLARTRLARQVTVLTLQKLQQEAYSQSESNCSFSAWKDSMCSSSPTFMYWDFILRYEMLILMFVAAHRDRNFLLYVEIMEKLVPLFFAMDHVNYARWTPVHIRDMKNLPDSIRNEFEEGRWVLSKTNKSFSCIPIDQAHEQENASVKGSVGFIGLTETPSALKRWMLSGPELTRLQNQFEAEYLPVNDPDDPKYFQNHRSGYAAQKSFHKQVRSLFSTIKNMGNPFLDDFPELVTLDSRNCIGETGTSNT